MDKHELEDLLTSYMELHGPETGRFSAFMPIGINVRLAQALSEVDPADWAIERKADGQLMIVRKGDARVSKS